MTNLLTKIKDIIVADLNETVYQKEKQNPIVLINQYLHQCEVETEKVGKLVERQFHLKDEFTREFRLATELAEKRKHQADVASKVGELELYQFAIAEHQQYTERAQRLNTSLEQVEEQLDELERKYEEMKQKLKDMHLRRVELMGRENVTKANLQMNQVLAPDTYTDRSYSKFKEIERYLSGLEQKVNSSFFQSTIVARVAQLEKQVDGKKDTSVNLIKE
jgi:lia operon protein LiaH